MRDLSKIAIPQLPLETRIAIDSANQQSEIAEQQSKDINHLIEVSKQQNKKIEQLTSVMSKQSQEIKKLVTITRQQGESTTKLSKRSLLFSFIAIVFAAGAIFFSYIDYKGDASWQKQQIYILTNIKEQLTPLEEENIIE